MAYRYFKYNILGWWVGATDSYNGWLFELSEKSVFYPQEPCRLEVYYIILSLLQNNFYFLRLSIVMVDMHVLEQDTESLNLQNQSGIHSRIEET